MEALGRLQAVIALVSWKEIEESTAFVCTKKFSKSGSEIVMELRSEQCKQKQRSAEANRCCALHPYGQDHALRPLQR